MSAPVDNQGVTPANTTPTLNPGGGGQAVASNVVQTSPIASNNQEGSNIGVRQDATPSPTPTSVNHQPDNALTPWAPRLRDPEMLMAPTSSSGVPEGSDPSLSVNYRFRRRIRLPHLTFDMSTLTEVMVREDEAKGI